MSNHSDIPPRFLHNNTFIISNGASVLDSIASGVLFSKSVLHKVLSYLLVCLPVASDAPAPDEGHALHPLFH